MLYPLFGGGAGLVLSHHEFRGRGLHIFDLTLVLRSLGGAAVQCLTPLLNELYGVLLAAVKLHGQAHHLVLVPSLTLRLLLPVILHGLVVIRTSSWECLLV